MIFNLGQFVKNQFPGETIYTNQKHRILTDEIIADRIVNLQESPGTLNQKTNWTQRRVQVYVRDVDSVTANELIFNLYDYLKDRNGCILPAVTVNSILYPAIHTGQIAAEQTPGYSATDQNGRVEMVFNLIIQFEEV